MTIELHLCNCLKIGHHDWTKNSSKNDAHDLFEKYIGILKFPIFNKEKSIQESPCKKVKIDDNTSISLDEILTSLDASKFKQRSWLARRVK